MPEQLPLYVESIYEALKTDCQAIAAACGNVKAWAKITGSLLWPQKLPDEAAKLLNMCLDSNRHEKLDPEQVLWIITEARKWGSHATITYQCQRANFADPVPITPEDESAKLMREFNAQAKTLAHMLEKIERINTTLKAIK